MSESRSVDEDRSKAAATAEADKAVLRYAKYTAPAVLAVLGSTGLGTPVAAQTFL